MSVCRRATFLASIIAANLLFTASTLAQNSWVRKEAKEFDSYYLLELPRNHDSEKQYPLLISLHGMAVVAEDHVALWTGLAPKKGYVVAVPCGDWKAPDWNDKQRSWGERSPEFILWMVSDIRKTVNIDPDRIFLNGFSAGGHMTLYAGILNPDFFCALVPCSGCVMNTITDEELEKARFLPIRFIIGGKDMNYASVLKSVDRLKAAGFTNVVLRKFPNLAHQYPMDENPRVLEWFDQMHAARLKARTQAGRVSEAQKALAEGRFGDAARIAKGAIDAGILGEARESALSIFEKALAAGRAMLDEAKALARDGNEPAAVEKLSAVAAMFEGMSLGLEAQETEKRLMADPDVRAKVDERRAAAMLETAEKAASPLLAKALELRGMKKWSEALGVLDSITTRFPGTESAKKASEMAIALRADPEVAAAIDYEKNLKDCTTWFNMAENHLNNGDKEKAIDLYRKIRSLMPDSELGKKAHSRLMALK